VPLMAGALPSVYTEQIAQRELYHRDFASRSFLDLFQHRAISLFYAAWKKSRLPLQYETDRHNRFAPMVLALAGLGQESLHDRLQARQGGVDDESLAFFAGALQQRALSAAQLERLLARYLRVPVKVEQFVGRWYRLPPEARTTLGLGNGVLGRNALSGERVWQRDLRMRVTLGPMARDTFHRFLPGGPAELALRELLTLMTGVTVEYEVRLSLRACDVESVRLADSHGARLGWDGFLVTRSSERDRNDAGYDIHAMA